VKDRVELQTEVDAPREEVFALFATPDGLRRWLDASDLEPRVGGALSVRMLDAEAAGEVLSLQPPQHISFTWRWASEPATRQSVVALDAIDHGARTHVTLRHVGLANPEQVELHEELWRHWLRRFEDAAQSLPDKVEVTHP
jgi:uncharacterized protein YndB with AHSA1/START domain